MAKNNSARAWGIPGHAVTISRAATWLLLATIFAAGVPRPAQAHVASSILMDEASGRILQGYRQDSP
ncbi:MAG: hypothetical protein ACREIP_21245, partial [Alphaproteobacteria bacterium]